MQTAAAACTCTTRTPTGCEEGTCIDVHSKLMIVDDAWLRVGSANICNRSMRFDSECDLTLEAGDRKDVAQCIRAVRDGLLAEHLGVEPEVVARTIDSERIDQQGHRRARIRRLVLCARSSSTARSPKSC